MSQQNPSKKEETMNGYETYTKEELRKFESQFTSNLRQEEWAAEGDGLRAQVARSNVSEFKRVIAVIRSEIAKR